MKGILSFVKTSIKVPSMKLSGTHDEQDSYDIDNSVVGFKGDFQISDGVITIARPMESDLVDEETVDTFSMSNVPEVEEQPVSTMETEDNSNELLNIVNIEKPDGFEVRSNKKDGNDLVVHGVFNNTIIDSSSDIIDQLDSIKDTLGLGSPMEELVLAMENETDSGKTYTYRQFYKNIEVLGYNVRANMDYNVDELTIESCLIPSETLVQKIDEIIPKLSEKETNDWIRTLYPDATKIISSLIIYPDKHSESPKLAYLSYLYNHNDRSRRQQIITDANTGEIIYEDDMNF